MRAADAIRHAPRRIRKPIERAYTAWSTGALRNPGVVLKHWRHRRELSRLNRALMHHRFAQSLIIARETGLLAALSEGADSAAAVASKTGIHVRSAEALLRILESEGIVRRRGDRWRLSRFARDFLVAGKPPTLDPMLDLISAQARSLDAVVEGTRTGQTPPALDIFAEKGRTGAFLEAVNAFLDMAGRDLLTRIDLPNVHSFIVGSMGVAFSAAVLDRFPDAKVTYGCLEHLVREIPRLSREYNVPQEAIAGLHSHGGDPEKDRWGDEAYDLVFLTKKMILSPETRMGERFARKAFSVLRPGGAAIFWETLYCDDRPTPRARAMEGVMDLCTSPQGLVHTERQMLRLLTDIGYVRARIVPALAGQTTFAVGYKAN